MPFVKLDAGMLDSTIWLDVTARQLFITALLMAEPVVYDEAMPQIEVRTLRPTGWFVPPGRYGFLRASGPGIVHRALLDAQEGMAALERMGAPELDSRSQEFEGRRLVRVNGGYVVLNYAKYRDKDQTNAERQKRWREGRAGDKGVQPSTPVDNPARDNAVTPLPNGVSNGKVTHADADADADADAKKSPRAQSTPPAALVPAQPIEGELLPKGRKRASEAGTRLPDDFQLTAEMTAVAMAEGVNAGREFARFCDYWRALPGQRGRKADWLATWRNWCRKASDGGHSRLPAPQLKSAAELELEARARGEDPDELESERAARLAASPQGELYAHLLKPMAPRPEYRTDPGAVAVDSGVRGVQGLVRRG